MAVTVSKFNGDIVAIWADGTIIGHSMDSTLSVTQDLPDSTTKDSEWMEHIKGNRSWEVNGSGLVAFNSNKSVVDIIDYILNASNVTVEFKSSEASTSYFSGASSVTASSFESNQNSPSSFNFNFQGNGILSKNTTSLLSFPYTFPLTLL